MITTKIPSTVYGQSIPVIIYLPPCYPSNPNGNYPVLYLLHGGAADETQWPDLNVKIAADKLNREGSTPFVVVMPGGSYDIQGIDYSAFVLKELIPSIEAKYAIQTERSGRAIAGLSLGGYWALRIALLHPDLFVGVGGYSPVIVLYGADDPLPLSRRLTVEQLNNLKVNLDVGDQDSLRADTKTIAQALQANDVSVQFSVGEGIHDRSYWRKNTYQYFKFFTDLFHSAAMDNTFNP